MKLRQYLIIFTLLSLALISCSDDDDGATKVEIRDPEEVKEENAVQIEEFLQTHFFEFVDNPQNPNFQKFRFDTIAGDNQDRTPIFDAEELRSKEVIQGDVSYQLYYLKVREGNPDERHPKFSDSTLVTYQGLTLENETFDLNPNPIWFDLTQSIRGFYELMPELRGSSGFVQNPDGTVSFNDDFGIGVVFVPSGLGYFASPPFGSGISSYEPIIFSVQLYKSIESDHDQDGIPSYREDINGNGRVGDLRDGDDIGDDSDGDGVPDFFDPDDDGDGVPTRDEISDEDGNIIFPYPDHDNDGNPDYLDPDFPGDNT